MIEELKQRARAGDLRAVQELRDRGFFGAQAPKRTFALSHAQRRMWILSQDSTAGAAYNLPRAVLITGVLDRGALAAAFESLVGRHESLRTTFVGADDEPRQIVRAQMPFEVAWQDLRHLPDPVAAARAVAAADAPRPFDLEHGPLLRVHLLQVADTQHVLLVNVHHIVCDAWSIDVIVRDLMAFYTGSVPPALRIQYKDFARWHNQRLASAEAKARRERWLERLTPPPEPLDLPSDRPRRQASDWKGQTLTVELGRDLRRQVAAAAAAHRTGFLTVLVAAVKALLHLESGARDIVVGSPVAGRSHPDLEPQVGMFANAVAVRDHLTPALPFADVLSRVRDTIDEAFEAQDTPFDDLVAALALESDATRTPIFDVLVGLLNTDRVALRLDDLTIGEFETGTGLTPHDLVLYFVDSDDSLHLALLYRTSLFDSETMARFAARLRCLLERALIDPATAIGQLETGPRALRAPHPEGDLTRRIAALPGVADVAVVSDGLDGLLACVVARHPNDHDRLRDDIASLGERHVRYVPMTSLPLLPDGSLHVRKLERLAQAAIAGRPTTGVARLHVWDLIPPADVRTAPATNASERATPASDEGHAGPPAVVSGGELIGFDQAPWTLGAVLLRAAERTDDARLTFVARDGTEVRWSYAQLLEDARRILSGLRARGLEPGARVVLLLPEHGDVLPAFWGCVLGGFTPIVAAVPTDFAGATRATDHLAHLWTLLERPLLVTTDGLVSGVASLARVFDVTPDRIAPLSELRAHAPAIDLADAGPDDLAFFSLTSGSTGAPKCVMLSHRNVLARARGTNLQCGHAPTDVVLNWLPFDHIGSLSDWHVRCLDLACSAVYAAKEIVLGDPLQWLTLLDRHRATHSWAPNFAYSLVTTALDASLSKGHRPTWDLSCVQTLLTAGEAVTPTAVEAFQGRLAAYGLGPGAIRPAFGMAEMASGVTYGHAGAAPLPARFFRIDRRSLGGALRNSDDRAAATFADLGPPIPGASLRIVSDAGVVLGERHIGRLQVRGAPVSRGYYRDEAATRAAFLADGWFDTGDFGFLSAGHLALTGRAKEGIIVSGANYGSAEIEAIVEAVDGAAVSFVAAAAVHGPGDTEERLAVFFASRVGSSRLLGDVIRDIRDAILRHIGIHAEYIVRVRPEEITKTAIGKIQRKPLVTRFEAGDFASAVRHADLAAGSARTIPNWFARREWRRASPRLVRTLPSSVAVVGGTDDIARRVSDHLGSEGVVPASLSSAEAIVHLDGLGSDNLGTLTDLVRVIDARGTQPLRLLVATRDAQIVADGDTARNDRAAWSGLVTTLTHEMPWVDATVVDVDGADVARCLATELRCPTVPLAGWRNGTRYATVLLPEDSLAQPSGASPFVSNALYLVAGGAGGIGLQVAAYLRERYGVRLLIVGRRDVTEVAEAVAVVGDSTAVLYRRADVTDEGALRAAAAEAEAAFGARLAGVVALAGVASERALIAESIETIAPVVAPKAAGLRTLAALAEDRCGNDGVFVAFSSVNGLMGGTRAGAYAAANAQLDAITDDLRRRGRVRCWTIAWSMWDDVGMSRGFQWREAARACGFHILRPDDALLSFDAALRRPPAAVVVGVDFANPHVARWNVEGCAVREDRTETPGHVRPTTENQRRIARIWEQLLGIADVGIHDHFVRLGGHSLKATQLVAALQQEFGVVVTLQDMFAAPTIAGLSAVIDRAIGAPLPSIPRLDEAPDYAVSHAQRRLWVLERMGLAATAYTIASATRISGDLDPQALARAFEQICRRHESLRTTFSEVDGEPRQVVHPDPLTRLESVDVSSALDADAGVRRHIERATDAPFDLERGPLVRMTLYRTAPDDAVLLVALHHSICDGLSMDVLVAELLAAYEAARRGTIAPLPPLRVQYRDFAAWQNALVTGAGVHRRFWMETLAGELPVLDLPADRPRPKVQAFAGATCETIIAADVGRALRSLAKEHGATMFAAWLAVVRAVLFRYVRATDAIIGTPVAGREHPDLAGVVGFFVNMLPLRLRADGSMSAADLIDHAASVTSSALAHQLYPYDTLVDDLRVPRDAGRNPLFDVAISVLEHQLGPALPGELATSAFAMQPRTSKFDLTFFLVEAPDGAWRLIVEYATDLYDAPRMARMAAHVAALAGGISQHASTTLSDLELLPPDERHQVLNVFPFEPSAYPRDRSIVALFDEQCEQRPHAEAVCANTGSLTYAELRTRARGVAGWLRAQGVTPGDIVGVRMPLSEHVPVALLGILYAGAAYLPIDPSSPEARLNVILDDAGCRIVLSDLSGLDLPAAADPTSIDELPSATSLAYVMYTSGSTGQPKGTLIEHRSVVRLVKGANFLQLGDDDRMLQAGSLAFDASTFEVWGPLLNGGCVCFPERGDLLDAQALAEVIDRWRITAMFCTTGLLNQMVEADARAFAGLRHLIFGGEQVSVPHIARLRSAAPAMHLIHGYGPTENTTFTTCHHVEAVGDAVPLGRPISNTTVFVLDADQRLSPIGVPGEICVGGDGLARGYLNDPALSAARFVPHPYLRGERLYRTGDAGVWQADGLLEFVGRLDEQVKVRGYRIEPGEIASAMRALAGVRDAVVTTRRTSAGTLELIGYWVGEDRLAATLRELLAATLPDYMIPSHVVRLDRFPLNQNGKVDRARLPAPSSVAESPVTAPRNQREALLVDVLQPLLGGGAIGVDDSYFDIGGDSIRAIQLVSRVRARGWTLRVRDVFDAPRLRDLATKLAPAAAEHAPRRTRARLGPVAMLPAQQWFFAHHTGAIHHFNQAVLLRPAAPLDGEALAAALRAIVEHHDSLRLTFPDGRAEIRSANGVWLEAIDLTGDADAAASMARRFDAMHQEFDLAHGPLFRAAVVHLPEGGQRLWLAAHHLCVDGVSWRIIVADLATAYGQAARGEPVDLGPATASCGDRAEEIVRAVATDALADEAAYWQLANQRTPVGDETHGTYDVVEALSATLSDVLTRQVLADAHHAYGTTANELMLAALGWACRDAFGTPECAVTVEGHGRQPLLDDDLDLTRTVGWFTALYPVILPGFDQPRDQIRHVKDLVRRVPREGLAYGAVRMTSAVDAPSVRRSPRLSFNYLGHADASDPSGLFQLADESSGAGFGAVTRAHGIDVVVLSSGGHLHVTVAASHHQRARAEQLLEAFTAHLTSLVSHCHGRAAEPTLMDLTSPPDSLERFDALLAARARAAADVADVCRATGTQAALVALALIDPLSRAYHVQMAYTLSGSLQRGAFEQAWTAVCDAHPMLRSVFAHRELEAPTRIVLRSAHPDIVWHDLRRLDPAAQRDAVERLRADDLARGFDFERAPLMRFTVAQFSESSWEVLWSYHHAILDGWSLGVVFTDFAAAYDAAVAGAPVCLTPAPDPAALVRWTDAQATANALAWWSAYLSGSEATALPSEPRSGTPRDDREYLLTLDEAVTRQLARAAAQWDVTLATLVQASWARVLARYTGHEDVVFGTIVSGRPAAVAGAERMVGALINAVPVRAQVAGDATLESIARALQQAAIDAEPYHWLPLAEIQGTSPVGRDLISHLVVIENYPIEQRLAAAAHTSGLLITGVDAHDRTHYAFTLNVVPGTQLQLRFQYDASVYPPALVQQIARDYESLITEQPLHVAGPRFAPRPSPPWTSIVDAFAARVASTPSAPAIVDERGQLSYGELANEALAVADDLRANGVEPGDLVAVVMERGRRMPAAVLGVLYAGAAYVPVDPSYPPSRIDFVLEDSGCSVVLTSEGLVRTGRRQRQPDAAYVIYTSGSTGAPKGVVISHSALNNQIAWLVQEFAIEPGDRMLQKTPIAFDASVWEIFAPLAAGAAIVLVAPGGHVDPDRLADAVERHGVTLLQLVPSQLAMMQEAGWHPTSTSLRTLFLGGEAVDPALLARLPQPCPFEVVNLYGPTETCINATFWRWDGRTAGSIPIGSPTGATAIVVLDRHRQPVPRGAIGEIGIAGANLAVGYHHRPELTKDRFVDIPSLGARVYLTGDLGRWAWSEDVVEYCGRADHQAKIRGHRVECGEVEFALRALPGVRDACVVVRRDGTSAELVAFVVAAAGTAADGVRAALAAALPPAAIPSALVIVDALPMAPGGKVDRRALERASASVTLDRAALVGPAPRTPLEETLARIWCGVLERTAVGVDESFFDAGGHSLKAMQVVSRIARELGIRVSIGDVFAHPTIAALARVAGAARREALIAIPVAPLREHYALSHAQQRLWLLHCFPGGETAYNMPFALRLEGAPLDVSALERAFETLVERHEALRTTFIVVDGEPRQRILERVDVPMRRVDLRSAADADAEAKALAVAEAHTPFDLAHAPLLRVCIVHVARPTDHALLLLTMHHIVGDGWSAEVLAREIAATYHAARRGVPVELPPLRLQYRDYSEWEATAELAEAEAWWMDVLADANQRIALPYDFAPPALKAFGGAIVEQTVDPATTTLLRSLASAKGVTLSHTVLSLFMLALSRISGQQDLIVGMSVANRNHPDLETLIGFFVNVLPIRVQIAADMDLDALIAEVSRMATAALERQDYPFDRLVQRLNPRRAATDQPLVNVVYAFQNFTDVNVDVGAKSDVGAGADDALRITPFDVELRTSKFDLTLFVTDERETLRLTLEYDTALFTAATAHRYLAAITRFLGVAAGSHGASA